MKILDIPINLAHLTDRFEFFVFGDAHIGKWNTDEHAIRLQVTEVLRRSKLPGRYVRAFLGGDNVNAINIRDVRRFDFSDVADWMIEGDARTVKEKLNDMAMQEVDRAAQIFAPIQHLLVGALHGYHETSLMKQHNLDVHKALCTRLGTPNLTTMALLRFRFIYKASRTTVQILVRHGYGSGRSPGAEPTKLERLRNEWETVDVCLTGHTHTFCIAPPKPVLYVPARGTLPERLMLRYRHAGNWGCWQLSHKIGPSTYEEGNCYEAKPLMTLKVVVWPFWGKRVGRKIYKIPKIELRNYPLQ